MTSAWESIRHAARSARRSPRLAGLVTLTLALGIGANATVFGVVDRVLLRAPDHIADPDRARMLFVRRTGMISDTEITSSTLAYPDFVDVRTSGAFRGVAAVASQELVLGSGLDAEPVETRWVTGEYFPLLGTRAAHGRLLDREDDGRDAPVSAVLGHGFWERRFGGDPGVVGRTLDLGDAEATVVGVAPEGFTGVDLEEVDVWLPFQPAAYAFAGDGWKENRNWWWVDVVVRIAPGTTVEAAEAEATRLHRVGRSALIDEGRYDGDATVEAASLVPALQPGAPGAYRVSGWLAGVALVVLLVACVNVTNLLLARGERRERETGIRRALGISRRRIIAEIVLESTLLAAAGAAAALVVTRWGGEVIRSLFLPGVAWSRSPVGGRVLLFTAAACLATGVAAGLGPALRAIRTDLAETLHGGAREGGIRRSRIPGALSAVQAALCALLLVGGGLFVASLREAGSVDLGVELDGVVFARPVVDPGLLPRDRRLPAFRRALDRIRGLPGVESAGAASSTPFRSARASGVGIPGLDSLPDFPGGGPYVTLATPGFFEAAGIRILRGRPVTPVDREGAPRTVVVSETMARALWPEEEPLGRCLLVGPRDERSCAEVVGIAENAHRFSLEEPEAPQYYLPLAQQTVAYPPEAIVVRAEGSLGSLPGAIRRRIVTADPGFRHVDVRTGEEVLARKTRSWRLGAALFTAFGLLALVLAAVGLYSILAFDVSRRTRELGIRAALGATRERLVGLVLKRGTLVGAAGVVGGLLLAVAVSGPVEPLLFGVSAVEPAIYGTVGLVLVAVTLAAGLLPALRATRADPMDALREE